MGLLDLAHLKIKNASECQKRRITYAWEYLCPPKLLLIQEPLLHLDRDSTGLVMNVLLKMREQNTAVIALSTRVKDAMLTGDVVFRIEEGSLSALKGYEEESTQANGIEGRESEEEMTQVIEFKVLKIPAKLEDRTGPTLLIFRG